MSVESIFSGLNISASGLSAQRQKLNAISSNIANVNTTRTESGEPYRRQITQMSARKITAFERVLRKQRLHLETSHRRHFPFRNQVFRLNGSDEAVDAEILRDTAPFQQVYDPTHPDANEEGYVSLPNINIVSEMVDMIAASRAYEANLSSIDAAKQMAQQALDI